MSPERVRCRHGFPSEICPSCLVPEDEPFTDEHLEKVVAFARARRERYAKALAVVEAARGWLEREHAYSPLMGWSDQGRAVAQAALRAALVAFDEVEGQ